MSLVPKVVRRCLLHLRTSTFLRIGRATPKPRTQALSPSTSLRHHEDCFGPPSPSLQLHELWHCSTLHSPVCTRPATTPSFLHRSRGAARGSRCRPFIFVLGSRLSESQLPFSPQYRLSFSVFVLQHRPAKFLLNHLGCLLRNSLPSFSFLLHLLGHIHRSPLSRLPFSGRGGALWRAPPLVVRFGVSLMTFF